jgi:signal transduction histidine kinase
MRGETTRVAREETMGHAVAPGRARTKQRIDANTARRLRERVKELTCLYTMAQVSERFAAEPRTAIQRIAELIPPAWQYPEITSARITLDGIVYGTPGFGDGLQKQSAAIAIHGQRRGTVEVAYRETMPELDEGPFLREERALLEAIARQVALVLERRDAEEEKMRLHKQLMHADRLATIGQLAAGVAHELNEPLTNILGFAQLARKARGVPPKAGEDLRKIVDASLHARDIIKQLLLFARQTPTHVGPVDLNAVVSDGLGLFAHRFEKEAIQLVTDLPGGLPPLTADAGQLTQVIVNLVVNAVQAMPDGGTLTVETAADGTDLLCIVTDTGMGMTEEVLDRIFVPFFTTKDVDKGTGLGLPVVHGIVTSHGGTIEAQSNPGQGTRFTVRLPVRHESPMEVDTAR